jgi:hypothetical protein
VLALVDRVNKLKGRGSIGVIVVANWLDCRVMPLMKQIHPDLDYNGIGDPTYGRSRHLKIHELNSLLSEMFVCVDNWPTPKEVHSYDIQVARDWVH